MFDWDPDWEDYYDGVMREGGLGEYGEDYTRRPLAESNTRVGETHHPNCPDPESWECCKSLWEADYQVEKDEEAEELHETWWQ